jgi:hypothetical protein
MDNKGKQAFRSGSTLALPPEELDDVPPEQEQIDDEQTRQNATYASLKNHAGWQLIKKDFEETIARYRSGAVLKDAVPNKSLEELGKLTLVTNMVADELEHKLLTVEAAAAVLEEENSGRRKSKGV